jgi:peptide/nickel transport system permease protein
MAWSRFRRDRWAMAGLAFVLLLAAVALLAPLLAGERPILEAGGWRVMPPIPYSPTGIALEDRLSPPGARHWLGTDDRGRDVAARMVHGSRVSLAVGLVAVSLVVLIGTVLGALAGYHGGWVDAVISRATEVMMCFPTFFLILALLAFLPPSILNIMGAIGLTGWPGVARLVRAEFLRLRHLDYVTAARAIGASDRRIIFVHILPNALGPVLVTATFGVAGAVLVESSLSYLGFGVPPPAPSWGDILSLSKSYIDFAWWLTVFPGAAIFLTVTAFNLVGEGLRDAVDPRLH